jgi:hypothetical protein
MGLSNAAERGAGFKPDSGSLAPAASLELNADQEGRPG